MRRAAAWVTSPDGTPPAGGAAAADGEAVEQITTTQTDALNQIVAVDRPQSVELNGIASALATLELQATPQPSAQVPEPATVIAALPPNQNRPPASGEPDGWSHWLSDTGTASFGQWPKVKVKATTQSETLGTLVDEVEGRVWIKPDESPVYDPRGNLIQDGGWSYEWDARNRLLAAEMRPQHLPNDLPQIRVEHRYDCSSLCSGPAKWLRMEDATSVAKQWMSRRVVTITKEKRVEAATGARELEWRVVEHRHFWYDGWHLMAETVQSGAPGSVATVTQRYIWGLDLPGDWERGMGQTRPQGSSTRTGGVGALLGVITSAGKTYSVCNDANGNVMGFIDLGTATLTARFDYDAFGNQITNWTAPNHPAPETITRVRFSSKHQDRHTGWLYYGYRWYDAENGRWPSRDPIEEEGGINLYGMVGNDAVNRLDYLGRNEVIVTGGCNINKSGWDIRGPIETGVEWPARAARYLGAPVAHDRNWSNFVDAAEAEISRRVKELKDGEKIEWHVEIWSYLDRAAADGKSRDEYINKIKQIAERHKVILRFFGTKQGFISGMNAGSSGAARTGQARISRFVYFGHGTKGNLDFHYNDALQPWPDSQSFGIKDVQGGAS